MSGGVDAEVEPLLKRAFLFLEEGNWKDGDAYCERVLDRDPECARAYIGKLMAELQVRKEEEMPANAEILKSNNYRMVMRFADAELKARFDGGIKEKLYLQAAEKMAQAETEKDFQACADQWEVLAGYRDADSLREVCLEEVEELDDEDDYREVIRRRLLQQIRGSNYVRCDVKSLTAAIREAKNISGWKDIDELIEQAEKKARQEKEGEDCEEIHLQRKKKGKKWIIKAVIFLLLLLLYLIIRNS